MFRPISRPKLLSFLNLIIQDKTRWFIKLSSVLYDIKAKFTEATKHSTTKEQKKNTTTK